MSDDLDDRLRSLGEHLDAERAARRATVASNVVELRPRRRTRLLAAAAAVVLVLGGLFAITFTRHPDGTGVTATDPPVTTEVGPSDTLTIQVSYHFDDGSTDPAPAVQRLQQRAAALGLNADVIDDDLSDNHLAIVVQHVPIDEQTAVQRAFLDVGSSVQVRPVVTACTTEAAIPLEVSSKPAATQVLPLLGGDPVGQGCEVGPARFTNDIFVHDASAQHSDPASASPAVVVGLQPGADGEARWNELAAHCYQRDEVCPTQQIAIEYGGWIYSAPTVQTPEFSGSVQISGGFSDLEARALAAALNDGPAPFTLTAVPG
jgi:hypothetical protein